MADEAESSMWICWNIELRRAGTSGREKTGVTCKLRAEEGAKLELPPRKLRVRLTFLSITFSS
jgi:hypothetical protein